MPGFVTRYRVEVPDRTLGLDGLLDMLRYDQAKVLSWRHGDTGGYSVEMETEKYAGPETRRWESFGLKVEVIDVWKVRRDGTRVQS